MSILQQAFWSDRLAEVVANGQDLHNSVYRCNMPLWNAICAKHKQILAKCITKDMTVLDVGCGYGRLLDLKPISASNYLGVDLSIDFIQIARHRWPEHKFEQAYLHHSRIPEQRFDIAVCISIRHMIIQRLGEAYWANMLRDIAVRAKTLLVLEYDTTSEGDYYEL